MRRVFFLVGPTAVGKSSIAVDVAEELGAEIVNADAFQIYRGLDILTAKPDTRARRRLPHHLLDAVALNETMSAAKFRSLALATLDAVSARGKDAIVVSGSGLYVKALTHGFDAMTAPNAKLRADLAGLSLDELERRLQRLDPELAARIDLKNVRRVVRAIEIAGNKAASESVAAADCPHPALPPRTAAATTLKASGITMRLAQPAIPSEVEGSCGESLKVTQRDPSPSLRCARNDRNAVRGVFLVRDRDDLYARINERVQAMFRQGVEREVAGLKNVGPTAAQALGLRQIQQLLAGDISRDDCIAKIQQATRRYAKRQLTWFRHQTNFPQLNLTALSHREAVSAITRIFARE